MAELILRHLALCLLAGACCVVVCWVALWRKYAFLLNPLTLQLMILGAYMAAAGIPLQDEITPLWVALMGPQLLFFLTLIFVLGWGTPANIGANNIVEKRETIALDPLISWFYLILAGFVAAYFFVNLLGSGFSVDKDGLGGRGVVANQSKILFYIFLVAPTLLSVGIHLLRGFVRWISIALAISTAGIILLSGSKSGLVSLCTIAAGYFYLRWLDGELSDRTTRRIQLALGILVVAALVITPMLVFKSGSLAGILAIITRILSGFDMIIYLGISRESVDQIQHLFQDHHLSAASFIFSTPMKVMGIYEQTYDSMSQFLWDDVLRLPSIGNLPNDNLFVTLSIGVSPIFSAAMAVILPILIGGLYNTLLRRRYDSCLHLLTFWWLTGSIVSCILTPQLNTTSLMALGIVYAMATGMSVLTRRLGVERRGRQSSPCRTSSTGR
jgi:hypothetical protein